MNKFIWVLFLGVFSISFSQNEELELWSKLNFKKKINKNLSFSFEPGARYNLDDFFFTKQFADLSVNYVFYNGKISDFSVELGGRLTKLPNQKLLGTRGYASLYYSASQNKLKFSWRSRFFVEENVTNDKKKYVRNKITLQYVMSDFLRPFIDGEYMSGLDENNLDKTRFSAGNAFKFSKKTTIKLFYRIQESISVEQDTKRIFGFYLTQKL